MASGLVFIGLSIWVMIRIASKVGLAFQVSIAAILYVSVALLLKLMFGLQGDEYEYHLKALNILAQWENVQINEISDLSWTKSALSYILAAAFYFFGQNTLIGVLILIPFFLALPILIGQASYNFFGSDEIRKFTAWSTVLLPQTIMWSPMLLREGLSFFLIGWAIYASSLLYVNRIFQSTTIFATVLILVMLVRNQLNWVILFLFLAASMVLLSKSRFQKKQMLSTLTSMLMILCVFAITQFVTESEVKGVASYDGIARDSILREAVISLNADAANSLAFAMEPSQGSGVLDTLILVTRNLPASLIGPFPWQWKEFNWLVAGLDGLFMLMLLVLALLPFIIPRIDGAKVSAVLCIAATPLILANSLVMANFGIAMRVRANIALLLLPIAAYVAFQIFEYFRNTRKR